MKKLLVILSAVALVAAFSAPVFAGSNNYKPSTITTDPQMQAQGQGQGPLNLQGRGQLQGQDQCSTDKNTNINTKRDTATATATTDAWVTVSANVCLLPVAEVVNNITLKQCNSIDCAAIGNATGGNGGDGKAGMGSAAVSDVGAAAGSAKESSSPNASTSASDIFTVAATLPGPANGGDGGKAKTNICFADCMSDVQVAGLFASNKANACIGANQAALNSIVKLLPNFCK